MGLEVQQHLEEKYFVAPLATVSSSRVHEGQVPVFSLSISQSPRSFHMTPEFAHFTAQVESSQFQDQWWKEEERAISEQTIEWNSQHVFFFKPFRKEKKTTPLYSHQCEGTLYIRRHNPIHQMATKLCSSAAFSVWVAEMLVGGSLTAGQISINRRVLWG